MNKKVKYSLIILIVIASISTAIAIIKNSYSHQDLYEVLPINSIVIGGNVYEGNVNPNNIANSAIDYYKETNNENVKIYKYSGLDEKTKEPIWGTYDDARNAYIPLNDAEIQEIETILIEKYKLQTD